MGGQKQLFKEMTDVQNGEIELAKSLSQNIFKWKKYWSAKELWRYSNLTL